MLVIKQNRIITGQEKKIINMEYNRSTDIEHKNKSSSHILIKCNYVSQLLLNLHPNLVT